MGPYQRTPKYVARAIRSSGLGVRSVGPVGDFLDFSKTAKFYRKFSARFFVGKIQLIRSAVILLRILALETLL